MMEGETGLLSIFSLYNQESAPVYMPLKHFKQHFYWVDGGIQLGSEQETSSKAAK